MPEQELPFEARYVFQAYHFTDILKLKDVDRLFSQPIITRSATKLVYQEGELGYFFKDIFVTSDELVVDVEKDRKNEVLFERVTLDRLTLERVDLLALIVAQSCALEYFEFKVDELLGTSSKITLNLRNKGRLHMGEREINKFVGFCMLAKQDLVSSMYLLDKPDELWNDEVLDSLYREAVEMFELKDRYKTVDYKLKMMQDNLEIIADLLKNRRATLLELTIIILIFVEVVLFVYELWR
jgi:uncharacterized Rmd1/YagE family protein